MISATVLGPVAFPSQFAQVQHNATERAGQRPVEAASRAADSTSGPEPRNQAADAASAGRVNAGDDSASTEGETLAQEFSGKQLSAEDLKQIKQMERTDREVRQHELAHQTAGGQYTGGASYDYAVGPDGKRYVVAGQVPIDYGPVAGDPAATIDKMQTVAAAALAPMDPSPKDYQVAGRARQYMAEARTELAMQRLQEHANSDESINGDDPEPASESGDGASGPIRSYRDVAEGAPQREQLATA